VATLIAIHGIDPAKLEVVAGHMATLGAPTLRAVDMGDGVYYLLEGTHRAHAAARLGHTVQLDLVAYDYATMADLRLCDAVPGLDSDNTFDEILGGAVGGDRLVDCEVEAQ